VLAVLLLGDPVTNGQFAGVVLIVAGVAWLSKQTVDGDATPPTPGPGAHAAVRNGARVRARTGDSEGRLRRRDFRHVRTRSEDSGSGGRDVGVPPVAQRAPGPGDLVRSPNRRWYLLAGLSNSVFLLSYYAALSLAPVSLVVPILQLSP